MAAALIRRPQPVIYNSKGEPIKLTAQERARAKWMQKKINRELLINGLGYEINMTTLTTIMKKISEQKFFHIAPADYVPIRVGQGAWSRVLTTYRTYALGDAFETGIINTGGQQSRMATANTAVDAVSVNVFNWAKTIGWTIFDLEEAARSGNWDLVTSLEESRKENWDLGIQRIAFLGSKGNNNSGKCNGLLNQPGVTVDTATITTQISQMTTTELKTFVATVIEAYRKNCNRSAWPTHFIIPESDYNGLVSPASSDFPIKSTKALLEEAFKDAIPNGRFRAVLPCAYADEEYHSDVSSIAGVDVYTFLNYDEKAVRMDIPVDYTNTIANSLDNFNFQNVGYGQFTGVQTYRPQEMYYMTLAS